MPIQAYVPRPLKTDGVTVPPNLDGLAEQLARNVHEVWAAQRLSDGWVHGPVRSDAHKTHPGLVPYDDLSESEKDYDRRVALETVRMVLALGYRIVGPEASVALQREKT